MFDTGIWSVFKAEGPSACRLHVGTPTSSLSSVLCRKRVLSRGTMESRVGQLLNESSRPNTQHTPTLKTRLCSVANMRRQEGGFAAAVFAKRFLASFGGASSHFRAMGASSSVGFSWLQLISCFSLSWQRCVVVGFFLPSRKVVKQHESHDKRREKCLAGRSCGCSLCVFTQSFTLCC